MKSTDIPNGAIVLGDKGIVILVEFDDSGEPLHEGQQLVGSDFEKQLAANIVLLVHSVQGESMMLLKTLAVLQLHDKKGKPVAATALGRKDKLLPMLKNMRASFIERKQAKEKSVLPASPGNMDCGKGST